MSTFDAVKQSLSNLIVNLVMADDANEKLILKRNGIKYVKLNDKIKTISVSWNQIKTLLQNALHLIQIHRLSVA